LINQVIQWEPFEKNELFERVLWISPDLDFIYVIDLKKEKFPIIRIFKDVISALRKSEARIVPYKTESETMIFNCLPQKRKEEIEKAWIAIKDLVTEIPEIFRPDYRAMRVKDCMKLTNLSLPTVNRYLKRYWKSGRIGLINRYDNCGSPGKQKLASGNTAKRGRIRKITLLQPENIGINTDRTVHQKFMIAKKKVSRKRGLES
jgi:hypothetical protein